MKKYLYAIVALIAIALPAAVPLTANAQVSSSTIVMADFQSDACDGLSQVTGGTSCGDGGAAAQSGVNALVIKIVNLLSMVVGIVAVIMIIIGGFKYITSNGDSNGVSSAKNTIIFALVGLVIVALAQFLVRFVLSKVAG